MYRPQGRITKRGVLQAEPIPGRAGPSAVPQLDRATRHPAARHCRRVRAMAGLTLLELLTTLAVVAILLSAAVPGFRHLTINNQLVSQTNELAGALNLARNEAVTRNRTVSICQSSDGASCGGTGKQWGQGWLLFVNRDADRPAVVDPGEEVLRRGAPIRPGYSLRTDAAYATFLSYDPSGQPHAPGRFVLCRDSDLTRSRVLFVTVTGHAYLGRDGNHNRIPEDSDGNDVTTCNP